MSARGAAAALALIGVVLLVAAELTTVYEANLAPFSGAFSRSCSVLELRSNELMGSHVAGARARLKTPSGMRTVRGASVVQGNCQISPVVDMFSPH